MPGIRSKPEKPRTSVGIYFYILFKTVLISSETAIEKQPYQEVTISRTVLKKSNLLRGSSSPDFSDFTPYAWQGVPLPGGMVTY